MVPGLNFISDVSCNLVNVLSYYVPNVYLLESYAYKYVVLVLVMNAVCFTLRTKDMVSH